MGQQLLATDFTPEKLFRWIVLLCLIGMGGSAIYVTSHVGSGTESYVRAHDLASYFFTALWIFVFFYAQYRLVPRFIHRDLELRIGTWHALGSLALLLVGALHAFTPQKKGDVPSSMLFWIMMLGEGVFIGNVVWCYRSEPHALSTIPAVQGAKTSASRVPNDSAKNMGWPKSPVKLFGIGAAFLGAGGMLSLIMNVPAYRMPVPLAGQIYFVPYGGLWLLAAAPFAVFTMLYKFLVDDEHLIFADSMNRIHFVVTIVAVLDLVRAFSAWQQAMVSRLAELYFGPEAEYLAVLFGLSLVVFGINVYQGYSRNTIQP